MDNKNEMDVMGKIVDRAEQMFSDLGVQVDRLSMLMDLDAVHTRVMPLDLTALLNADAANFAHDIGGIRRHLNRDTIQLEDFFVPRFAKQ
jgi:hypothetical protein